MKVFAFDPATGKRGHTVLGHVNCHHVMNRDKATAKVPRATTTRRWTVASFATDLRGSAITAGQFGQRAVCFCLGEFKCGVDRSWEWVALIDNATQQ